MRSKATRKPIEGKYALTLEAFAEHLREPRTARQIADAAGCSKPTVYARVAALEKQLGAPVKRGLIRGGISGPLATTFSIAARWYRARAARAPYPSSHATRQAPRAKIRAAR
jgi:DNA-binding CsgD family transcriptional regulator